ncbi:MAG: multidrug efflux system outer membrane protein [Marinoscillum sp.]|jgi:multidrug efflux system outer membrane protein
MSKIVRTKILSLVSLAILMVSCTPELNVSKTVNTTTPESFGESLDSANTATISWPDYFTDQYLISLIDTALKNNQELNIMLQEIEISKNEVVARKGEYLPQLGVGAGAGLEKSGRYTRNGSLEANNDIRPGVEFPEPLGDLTIGVNATWEIDIWKKLRNAKKSAYIKYLASVDGKNFMVTNLVAEIANSYYELLALDNRLAILKQNIELQGSALEIVKLQKESARVTELAVRRFQGQVYYTKSLEFEIQQQIIETENKLNKLLGRYPKPIERDSDAFIDLVPMMVQSGIPSQLLENRPDVRQAELNMTAAKLDVKVAKASFYPTLGLSAGLGFQAYNAAYLLTAPESLLYGLAGEIAAPLLNRNAIKAVYYNANATQIQTVYNYEQTLINAYLEVANQLAKFQNLASSYELKSQQVKALTESIEISNTLFKSARADYMEVLLTQREALESRFELVETKMHQMNTSINIYRALGGGWK